MERIYLFDAETHKAIMGIPAEDEIPVNISNGVLSIGNQEFPLDEEFGKHLLDAAFDNPVNLAIKPEYVSVTETPNSLQISAKLEFVEQKTDYQAVYFSLKGIDGYFALKMKNDEKVGLGKEVNLFLPYQRLNVYDADHNKLNSREPVFVNKGLAVVKNVKGQMQIRFGNNALTYPENPNYPDGEYEILLKQDKLMPIFSRKLLKKGYVNPEMDNPKNIIKVSAYDEDVLGAKLLAYVQVDGFDYYCSFVMENNFSVYKMPKFSMYVPEDGFILNPKQ